MSGLHLEFPDAVIEAIAARVIDQLDLERQQPEPWLTVDQAAEHLACKPRRIYDLVSQRRIPHVKDGSRLLFRASELDASLERSHTVHTPSAIPHPAQRSDRRPVAKAEGHQ
jgi:excisionase family DNA binding protein